MRYWRGIRICGVIDELDSSLQPGWRIEGDGAADECEGALCSWSGTTQTDAANASQGVECEGAARESAQAAGCFDARTGARVGVVEESVDGRIAVRVLSRGGAGDGV
jgi:hypothetical protein